VLVSFQSNTTSCASLLGLSLPGFSGGAADFSPSFAAPILAGAIAALAVIGCSMIDRQGGTSVGTMKDRMFERVCQEF
jgi:hypothetical protein